MDIRGLHYFTRIAALGSLTRAAADLRIAQPALTRHMHRLEHELGVTLFNRVQRGVELTDAGRRFLESASRIIRDIERLPDDIKTDIRHPSGKIALGMNQPLCPAVVPTIIKSAREQHPHLKVKVVHASNNALLPWIMDGLVDLAIMPEIVKSRSVTPAILVREEMVLLTSPAKAPRKAIQPRDLADIPLIMGDANRSIVELVLDRTRAELNVDTEINDHETVRLMVQAGAGTTILPYSLVRRECDAGLLKATRIGTGIYRRIMLVAAPVRENAMARAALVLLIKQVFAAMENDGAFTLKA